MRLIDGREVQKYALLGKGASDVFKMLSVVGAYEYDGGRDAFCEANFVRTKVRRFAWAQRRWLPADPTLES